MKMEVPGHLRGQPLIEYIENIQVTGSVTVTTGLALRIYKAGKQTQATSHAITLILKLQRYQEDINPSVIKHVRLTLERIGKKKLAMTSSKRKELEILPLQYFDRTVNFTPAPQPVLPEAAAMPVLAQSAPLPVLVEHAPLPILADPAPLPVLAELSMQPSVCYPCPFISVNAGTTLSPHPTSKRGASSTMAAPDKIKALFEDLGKATLRGVRKCPKCGTYNGTRGISCKNKACDAIFKEKDVKKGHSAEAVKIITGSTLQVFSVRLRDRGPDYRGFVQLPLVQDQDGNPATVVDVNLFAQVARCFVDSCNRNTNFVVNEVGPSFGKSGPCAHVKAAVDCTQEAQPLTLKNSILNSLQVSSEMKQAIWLLATETTGPLVQRVTKNIMVVKCKGTTKQPLGFLHFAFFENTRNRQHSDFRFQCSCKNFKSGKGGPRDDFTKRCVHFYACICAFASDDKLAEEFAYYINLDSQAIARIVPLPQAEPSSLLEEDQHQQVLTVYQSMEGLEGLSEGTTLEVIVSDDLLAPPPPDKKIKKELSPGVVAQVSNALLTLQEQKAPDTLQTVAMRTSPVKQINTAHKPQPTPRKAAERAYTVPPQIEESQASISFIQWLASVTERINQTMHYQFDGNPDPLVFHAPQVMFDCLQQRISAGSRKKRLPNYTTAFARRDALPLGIFTKYTWHIVNVLHVKAIFDTPEMPLELSRSFVENRDGTFDLYEAPKAAVAVENMDEAVKSKNQTPIRPFELKTFLKVGNFVPEQKEPTPFIIEWIPDILPKMHIGELRIKLEYGHQRNGQIEQRVWTPQPELALQTIHVHEIG